MRSSSSFVLNFYVPLLVALLLLCAVAVNPSFIANGETVYLDAKIGVLGMKIPMPTLISKAWIIRAGILCAMVISVLRAVTIDFSKYFPERLTVDVYFDERGIERNLLNFANTELTEIGLEQGWKQSLKCYEQTVIRSLEELWKRERRRDVPDLSDFSRDLVHARGMTTFVVKRVSWLRYCIVKSSGKLNFDWDVPKKPTRGFSSTFELRETSSNHIRPKLLQLLRSPSVVLKPEFKQLFSIYAGTHHAPFDHIVIGLTRVYLLPFPSYSNTIYLWKGFDGIAIPVAYAVYRPELES